MGIVCLACACRVGGGQTGGVARGFLKGAAGLTGSGGGDFDGGAPQWALFWPGRPALWPREDGRIECGRHDARSGMRLWAYRHGEYHDVLHRNVAVQGRVGWQSEGMGLTKL